jgi:hypothetical protein
VIGMYELPEVILPLCLNKHEAFKMCSGRSHSLMQLNLCARWKLVVSFTMLPLCSQGKSPLYQPNDRLGPDAMKKRKICFSALNRFRIMPVF